MPGLKTGDTAPDFALSGSNGKTVKLSDYRGKNHVVLIFYPADQTPGCTKQLCSARDDTKLYTDAGAVVFGVNPGSQESHERFIERHSLTTPLLVDSGMKVAQQYDATLGFGPLKIVNRTVVVIDPQGKIVFYQRGMPNTSQIINSFKGKATANA